MPQRIRETLGTMSLNRRQFTARSAAASLFVAALTAAGQGGALARQSGDGDFDWRRFEGTKLRVLVSINPSNTVIKERLDQFEELTGISVDFEDLPENNARQKLTIEFTGGGSSIDVFYCSLFQEKALFSTSGWYTYIDDFLADPSLTSPDFDWDDFFQGAKDAVLYDGKSVGVPTNMDTNITYYRRDLLEEAGLEVPTTVEELEEVAKALHNPPDMYGFVARGQKTSNATQIDPYFRNFGGNYFDEDGNATLDTPENIAAVEFYGHMLREYGPPGVTNFSWAEASALMQQGRVATYTDGASFAGPFENPEQSTVVGQMGYGIFPAGPAGNFPPIFANALSIYSGSENKEAAWYFLQWAASKEELAEVLAAGVPVGRTSVWDESTAQEQSALPAEFFESVREMLEAGVPGLPPVIHVAEARDIISVGVIDVINGDDANEVMARVQDEFAALVEQEQAGE